MGLPFGTPGTNRQTSPENGSAPGRLGMSAGPAIPAWIHGSRSSLFVFLTVVQI